MAAVREAHAGPSRAKLNSSAANSSLSPRSDATKGSIVRIKLENFLTYDSVEFRPGPKLNVIIGPNGTGKSTIMCGICLGLAGKTSTIGRATHLAEYVKHGCSKANVEIELLNPGKENFIICREIRRDGSSSWSVNKKTTNQKAVEELMVQLNIQVGNLCQFLPQDRVADFVKMTQIELLENTEKAVKSTEKRPHIVLNKPQPGAYEMVMDVLTAQNLIQPAYRNHNVGSPEMFEQHSKLKALRNCFRDMESTFKNNADRLEKEKQNNQRLEEEVKNYQQRQHHLERIELLKKKKPWLEYEETRARYTHVKEACVVIANDLKQFQNQFAPLHQKIEACKQTVNDLEAKMKTVNNSIREAGMELLGKNKTLEVLADKILETQEDLKGRKSIEIQRRQRAQGLRQQLESLRGELSSVDDNTEILPLIEQNMQEIQKLSRGLVKIQNDKESASADKVSIQNDIRGLESQLRQLQDVGRRRLETLRRRNQHAHSAVLWLRENKNRFRKTIYEPIATLINVHDPKFAKYVEAHIANRDLFAFVCEDGNDMDEFLKEIRDNQKLRINAVLAPDQPLNSFQPNKPLSHLRQWGFHHYLKDMFTAPESVMCYLCRQFGIHQTPVGDEYTRNNIEQVLRESQLRNFYTEKHHYKVKQSRYTKNLSTMNTEIPVPNLLTETIDTEKQQDLQRNIKRCLAELPAKDQLYDALRREESEALTNLDRLKVEKKNLLVKRDLRKNLMARINQKEMSIKNCEESAINLKEEEHKFKRTIQLYIDKKCKLLVDVVEKSKELLALNKNKIHYAAAQADAMADLKMVQDEGHRSETLLQDKRREYQEAREEVTSTKDKAKELLTVAKRLTNLKQSEELPVELKDMFSHMPDTVEELETEIHNIQALADCLLQTDEKIVQDFTRRVKEIQNLEKAVQRNKTFIDQNTREMEKLKQQWLPALETLIQRINENFSRFFCMLGCAGEVLLNRSEVADDYDKYGICIKVKFRDSEQLKELTPFHQSGGERSVATVLYMLALQELTHVPFRCVDEINQGMDSTNERKVFELMVQTSCRDNTAQYFLLTPKLLPDLEFNSCMTVLCIYNGKETLNHTQWNVKDFIRRRADLPD